MNIDKRALREVAEKATKGPWEMEQENIWFTDEDGYTKHLAYVEQGDDVDDKQDHYNTAYIAAANPATMLALLDENIQLQREKDAIEAVALALRDDMRQARERLAAAEQERENWRISFDNERYRADKLAAALNAEREKLVMANRSLITQHTRANSAESRIAELEARTVCLPKLPVLGSTAERYEGFADGASSMRNECANAIHAAGIKVEGE
ncbi:ead/Ea22-like family protein [Salmonella enterica subsp. enterica serovar Mbandaka]|uniref:Ead/Ea22-like family protein n=8 Tax=Salmonella enterica TaxID=28901 RepID=A0A6C8LML0_SALET|nr:ead/Ea22-like family protein [Salmonella enterica]EAU3710245.1 ead/Ea22-like family protein [Salmonella enterica subsp. enterica]ECN1661067.1 ead/Ea22-like family protein [Salmonella enterica subsp. enterica serovar Montevideo]EDW4922764.1 ead/Ea22-like family protein [Salmonella enterica subsp. enterica serovar Worthington]EEJ6816151.1 ead/Ea22-like family protein [Salmonella enterica subsp. enterica serovar Thompson]EGB9594046.1 ead/Ea22-like family protein [Salmonella enterica subsp. ent